MDLKVTNSQIGFSSAKKHIKRTIDGAASGAVLGAAIQAVCCGVQYAKDSKTLPKAAMQGYFKRSMTSIKQNALVCAALNGAIALAYSIANSIKSKKNS